MTGGTGSVQSSASQAVVFVSFTIRRAGGDEGSVTVHHQSRESNVQGPCMYRVPVRADRLQQSI